MLLWVASRRVLVTYGRICPLAFVLPTHLAVASWGTEAHLPVQDLVQPFVTGCFWQCFQTLLHTTPPLCGPVTHAASAGRNISIPLLRWMVLPAWLSERAAPSHLSGRSSILSTPAASTVVGSRDWPHRMLPQLVVAVTQPPSTRTRTRHQCLNPRAWLNRRGWSLLVY